MRHVVITGPRRVTPARLVQQFREGKVHGLLGAIIVQGIPFRIGASIDGEQLRARALSRRGHRDELCLICAREKASSTS